MAFDFQLYGHPPAQPANPNRRTDTTDYQADFLVALREALIIADLIEPDQPALGASIQSHQACFANLDQAKLVRALASSTVLNENQRFTLAVWVLMQGTRESRPYQLAVTILQQPLTEAILTRTMPTNFWLKRTTQA